jgi:hypothetical protein
MRKLALLFLAALVSMSSTAQSAPSAGPQILVVGTYHMSNPGQDIFNMSADDVLAPKRQSEIAELLEVLKAFHPTKIAIEADVYRDRAQKEYADYLVGKYDLSRNEIDQIDYRLAKELGMKTIYSVDFDGDFPMQRVINYAKAKGQSQELDQLMSQVGNMVKKQDEYLHSHTILETLSYMNADAKVAEDLGFYARWCHYGEPGDYAGPDLLASWYQRNARIYNNIAKIVESPNERILVIYGAGHLGLLRQNVASDPTMTLRKLSDFAGDKAK